MRRVSACLECREPPRYVVRANHILRRAEEAGIKGEVAPLLADALEGAFEAGVEACEGEG